MTFADDGWAYRYLTSVASSWLTLDVNDIIVDDGIEGVAYVDSATTIIGKIPIISARGQPIYVQPHTVFPGTAGFLIDGNSTSVDWTFTVRAVSLKVKFAIMTLTAYVMPDSSGSSSQRFDVRPEWYRETVRGGCSAAEFSVEGERNQLWLCLDLIRREIRVYDERNQVAWWGMVYEVRLNIDGTVFGFSLDGLRIASQSPIRLIWQTAAQTAKQRAGQSIRIQSIALGKGNFCRVSAMPAMNQRRLRRRS